MEAPATAAPLESRTEPAIAPRSDCATAVPTATRAKKTTRSLVDKDRLLRILAPPEVPTAIPQNSFEETRLPLQEKPHTRRKSRGKTHIFDANTKPLPSGCQGKNEKPLLLVTKVVEYSRIWKILGAESAGCSARWERRLNRPNPNRALNY